ncbi:MAG: hypothetical protein BroJett005_28660 [Ignavibacteriota bacterium]|nr:MAG: hypothetical protein BroJett005_28660 [Ignavibacteriota bacterium]
MYIYNVNQNHPQNVIGSYNGLPTDFDLRFNGSICPNNYAALSLGDENWNNCNVPGYYAGDPAEVNIIQGSEYVEFIDISTETILGNAVQLNDYVGINNIGLKRKDNAPSVQTTQIVSVEASINGVKDTSEIDYYPDGFTATVEVYPETLTTSESTYIDISYYSECGPLPPETKINLEIIDGTVYGNLIDPYTNDRVKTITNLDHWWGYAWVDYISDGVSVTETQQVVIRVSTTDPMTEPKEVILYIQPPPIYVYTIPEVVGVADTALIVIKKRNPDGTLEDFPAEQVFEVAATEGCINGNILVGDSLGVYFAAAQQPIYFVAADNIEGDSGYVRLRVGTDIETISTKPVTVNEHIYQKRKQNDLNITELREGYKQMLEEKRQLLNKNEAEKKEEELIEGLIIEACFTGYFSEIGYWQGDVLVKKDGCDEWACQAGFNKYKGNIEIQEVRENYSNINYCSFSLANVWPPAAGIFKPLFDEEYPNSISEKIKDQLIVNYSLNVCFDSNNGYWKYQIPENVILLRSILDVCEDNILSGTAQYLIHNLNELSIIPDEEVCLALENFEDQRLYGGGGKYYLIAPVWAHEKVHKANFEKLVNEVLNIKKKHFGSEYRYKNLLANVFQPECNETTNSESKAQFRINKHLNDILSSFIIELKERYDIAKADKDNEITTQNHPDVQWKITEYKKALQNNRLKNLWKDCSYKEKDF